MEEGDLIARKIGATAGEPGESLDGTVLETTDGQDFEPRAGEGARLVEQGVEITIVADRDGGAKYQNNTVTIDPVLRINGDVDYELGNIDFDQDVQISGSVLTGFSVSSGGDLTVVGIVESGATVRSKGDLSVSKGILGETTTVVALGNQKAQFVQNATVLVFEGISSLEAIFTTQMCVAVA